MFFLLPEEEKRSLRHEYIFRRWGVISLLFLFLTVVAIFLLVPSYSGVRIDVWQLENQLEVLQLAGQDIASSEEMDLIENISFKVSLLQPQETITSSDILNFLVESRPAGVTITSFSYDKSQAKETKEISIHGLAVDRRALLNLVDTLRDNPAFVEVNLPVRDLTRDVNINFNLKIVVDALFVEEGSKLE